MSELPLPSGLGQLRHLDPQLADTLENDFRRVLRATEALHWAQERLPRLVDAPSQAARLAVLVEEARALTAAPEVWAVTWTGSPSSPRCSFQAIAGEGRVPAPEDLSHTVVARVAQEGRPIWTDDALADARFASAESVRLGGLRSVGCVPIGEKGVLYLQDPERAGRFGQGDRARLGALCNLMAQLSRRSPQAPLPPPPIDGLVGQSQPMMELRRTIHAFAAMPWAALVLGETGTGKEAVARALHELSPRKKAPFVALNCGAIPEELAESTLFGHEKGAFTGADRRREGLVRRAEGGTLFLDEVGELAPRLQAKLLRLLQQGTYEPVGGDIEQRFQGRVVAATHRNLSSDRGSFREDLYYRLAACVIRVPPLRDRLEDVPLLAEHLLARALSEIPGANLRISEGAMAALRARVWPGNVRELENAIRGGIARALGEGADALRPPHFEMVSTVGDSIPAELGLEEAVEVFQAQRVAAALAACGGNRTRAAEKLKVSRAWLYKLLARGEEEQ